MLEDKLTKLHELIKEHGDCEADINIGAIGFHFKCPLILIETAKITNKKKTYFSSLDDAIQYLEEKLKPKPKFAEGDVVYYVQSHTIFVTYIDSITYDEDMKTYVYSRRFGNRDFFEGQLFRSREEAIQKQIDFWESKLQDEE